MECPVCYCNNASCKLVCGHSFCKGCVKTWYFKSDEPSCPMCRRDMYFKGMHRVSKEWEEERALKKNEDAFNQAFEDIFDEIEDSGSESSWESWDEELDSEEDEHVTQSVSDNEDEVRDESAPQIENSFCFPPCTDLYSDFILGEIKSLQKDYQKSIELGVDFDWYMENFLFFDIEPALTTYIEDDVFPHFKNLFVSNHKNVIQNKRLGKRNYANTDTVFTIVLDIVL